MGHTTTPEAEALLDQEIRVLDKGFVRMVDYVGGDERIVQSARVSYGKGTKSVREDMGLINYLMRHRHTSPFEQVSLTFHTRMPIFVARQWVRHRTAKINEISGRYSILEDEFYVPDAGQIRPQSQMNRQGRGHEPLDPDIAATIIEALEEDQRRIYSHYEEMIEKDVARELARINLPVSLYTEWYWKCDLHNLFHFLALRMDDHAQYEIRVYAEAMAKCAKAVAPMAYDAFEEHVLGGMQFSREELQAIRDMIGGRSCEIENKRRRSEFFEKLDFEDPKAGDSS
jgi:thymidylate synthase (FAD)